MTFYIASDVEASFIKENCTTYFWSIYA